MKTAKIKITPSQVKAIQAGKIRGTELAKKLGCSIMGMWQALRKRYGYKARHPWHVAKLNKKDLADYNAGRITQNDLAKRIGCSAPTIVNRLKKSGAKTAAGKILKLRMEINKKKRQSLLAADFKTGKSLGQLSVKYKISAQRISQLMAGMFGHRVSGWRPVWCAKCKKEMLASRSLKVICPKCSDLKKVRA